MKFVLYNKSYFLGLVFFILHLCGVFGLFLYGQSDFVVDPLIDNNGPVVNLVTSNLPKEPLIIVKDDSIDWENPGIRVEQLRIIAEALKIRFSYSLVPWARALQLVEDGVADAVFVTGFSEERARWGQFPITDGKPDENKAISRVSYWLYSRRGDSVSWDGNILKGITGQIGANNKDLMTDILKEEGLDIVEVKTYEQLINMLQIGRLNAIVGFRDILDQIISEDPGRYENIIKHQIPLRIVTGYLMFSKEFYNENAELTDEIWEMIRVLYENGTMNRLYREYDFQ